MGIRRRGEKVTRKVKCAQQKRGIVAGIIETVDRSDVILATRPKMYREKESGRGVQLALPEYVIRSVSWNVREFWRDGSFFPDISLSI